MKEEKTKSLSFKCVFYKNSLSLIGALLLLIGLVIYENYPRDFSLLEDIISIPGVIIILSLYLGFVINLSIDNFKYFYDHFSTTNLSSKLITHIPFLVNIAIIISAPFILNQVSTNILRIKLKAENPLRKAILEVCDRQFQDPSYIDRELRNEDTGDIQIADIFVSIWEDESGDALWFDVGDSLSAFGYICVRDGVQAIDAITHYDFYKRERYLLEINENFYYWR